MSVTGTKRSLIQKTLCSLDRESCEFIANWLNQYLKALDEDKHIRELGLSTRAYNVLKANGIYTLQQLVTVSADWNNIKLLKGVGEIVEAEIQKKVIEYKKEYTTT